MIKPSLLPGAALLSLCLAGGAPAPAPAGDALNDRIAKRVGPWQVLHLPGDLACHAALAGPGRSLRLDLSHVDGWRASARLFWDAAVSAAGRPVLTLAGKPIPGVETVAAPGEGGAQAGLQMRFDGAGPLSTALMSGGFEFTLADGRLLTLPTPHGFALLAELVRCADAVSPTVPQSGS